MTFSDKYDELSKMPVNELTVKFHDELVDLAETKDDFKKVEKLHLTLALIKTSKMSISCK